MSEELKDVPPMEWHNFKKLCPNVRFVLNSWADEISDLKKQNAELMDALGELIRDYKAVPVERKDGNRDDL